MGIDPYYDHGESCLYYAMLRHWKCPIKSQAAGPHGSQDTRLVLLLDLALSILS